MPFAKHLKKVYSKLSLLSIINSALEQKRDSKEPVTDFFVSDSKSNIFGKTVNKYATWEVIELPSSIHSSKFQLILLISPKYYFLTLKIILKHIEQIQTLKPNKAWDRKKYVEAIMSPYNPIEITCKQMH